MKLTTRIENAGPAGGFVLLESKTITDGDVTFHPWVGANGEVGYRCKHADGRVEFLYFNPSTDDGVDGGPGGGPGNNVFVYQGTEGDPSQDRPFNFYYVFDPEDWDEPEGINAGVGDGD